MVGLRVISVVTVIAFAASLVFTISCYMKEKSITSIMLVVGIALSYITNNAFPQEVFWWWTGIAIYTIPLILSIFVVGISEKMTSNKVLKILGILCTIMASGGGLDVVAFLCSMLLISVCIRFRIRKQARDSYLYTVLLFVIAFMGACINAFAPGNFERARVFRNAGEKVDFVGAFVNTIHHTNVEIKVGIKNGILPLVIVLIVAVAYYDCKKIGAGYKPRLPEIVGLILACYMGSVITQYPVICGIGPNLVMPGHCQFIEDVSNILFLTLVSYNIGAYIADKTKKEYQSS